MRIFHGKTLLASGALAALLALAGCGVSTKTVTVGSPPPAIQGAASTTGASRTGARTTNATAATSTTGGTPAAPTKTLTLGTFRSPTGNIGCVVVEQQARCDIERRDWKPPARPPGCPTIVDFGQGLQIQRTGTPGFVCAGDTVRDPQSPVLAYGEATRVGGFECLSSTSGMTCRRPADGHGFFLSIQSYHFF